MGSAVATSGGRVAVGHDFPEHARVWRPSDGLVWDDVTDSVVPPTLLPSAARLSKS